MAGTRKVSAASPQTLASDGCCCRFSAHLRRAGTLKVSARVAESTFELQALGTMFDGSSHADAAFIRSPGCEARPERGRVAAASHPGGWGFLSRPLTEDMRQAHVLREQTQSRYIATVKGEIVTMSDISRRQHLTGPLLEADAASCRACRPPKPGAAKLM